MNPFDNALMFGDHLNQCQECKSKWDKMVDICKEIGEHIENA